MLLQGVLILPGPNRNAGDILLFKERPGISDESVLLRWMQLEIGKINRNIVTARKPLAELLSMDRPVVITRSGEEYPLSKAVLELLGERLPRNLHRLLQVPVPCYFDCNVTGSCLITDKAAIEALRFLGEISPMRPDDNDRVWIGKPIMYDVMNRYPSLFQVVMT